MVRVPVTLQPPQPATAEPQPRPPDSEPPPPEVDTFKRLQEVYGGRISAPAMIETVDPRERLRRLKPFFIAGLSVLLFLALGFSLGLTRLGVFGVYNILGPPRVRLSSAAGAAVTTARKALGEGTYQSEREAFQAAEQAQGLDPKAVEPAALMVEAAALRQWQFGGASTELARARNEFAKVADYGEKEPEAIRAQASLLFAANQGTSARVPLEALARAPRTKELRGSLPARHELPPCRQGQGQEPA